jgi:hypothetical protein
MTESYSADELAVGRLIQSLADLDTSERDPGKVARAVVTKSGTRHLARPRRLAVGTTIAAFVVAAAVVIAVIGLSNNEASSPATGHVHGLTYTVAVARSLDLSEAQLTPFGTATQNGGFVSEDATAYQVDETDPGQLLVMKLKPGQHDDAGSIGNYLVLVRGDGFSLLCDYFADDDPLAPSVCP